VGTRPGSLFSGLGGTTPALSGTVSLKRAFLFRPPPFHRTSSHAKSCFKPTFHSLPYSIHIPVNEAVVRCTSHSLHSLINRTLTANLRLLRTDASGCHCVTVQCLAGKATSSWFRTKITPDAAARRSWSHHPSRLFTSSPKGRLRLRFRPPATALQLSPTTASLPPYLTEPGQASIKYR